MATRTLRKKSSTKKTATKKKVARRFTPPAPALSLRRVILFTRDVDGLARFYTDVLGLRVVSASDAFADLDAGGMRIGLHAARGESKTDDVEQRPHKLAFYADDVDALRADLVARGAALGPVKRFGALTLCDGRDPDGNAYQLSNRA
jgi:catechol 2,3-dioxygenase-like lactoylglutathione lyase family enzyme